MKRIYVLMMAVVAIMLVGCRCSKPVVTAERVKDSVVYIQNAVPVVVEIKVPYERVVNMTRDTVSTVETSVAVSTASVSGGVLLHLIENKNTTLKKDTIVTETISIKWKTRDVVSTIEVNKQRWWQTMFMWMGIVWLIIIVIRVCYRFLKR